MHNQKSIWIYSSNKSPTNNFSSNKHKKKWPNSSSKNKTTALTCKTSKVKNYPTSTPFRISDKKSTHCNHKKMSLDSELKPKRKNSKKPKSNSKMKSGTSELQLAKNSKKRTEQQKTSSTNSSKWSHEEAPQATPPQVPQLNCKCKTKNSKEMSKN
jgi:hypothetical protein